MKVGTAHAFPTLLTDFLKFKKNYPFYPFLILRIILFSSWFVKICLKLRQGLTFCKDRKRIKISELVEYIVDLVFVGQVCPTDKPCLKKCYYKIILFILFLSLNLSFFPKQCRDYGSNSDRCCNYERIEKG